MRRNEACRIDLVANVADDHVPDAGKPSFLDVKATR
jgi:hypothetical protein